MAKSKFYDVTKLVKSHPECQYNIVFGERSNGKTTSALKDVGLKKYFDSGEKEQFAYIRRWDTDIKRKNMTELFAFINTCGEIGKLSKGKYDTVLFRTGKFYMAKHDGDDLIVSEYPCGFVFALNNAEHDKSVSYPNITTLIFDEFISRMGYLADEFVTFTNVVSTIVRQRDDVKIFMLGNTVNKFCPYFGEMGLKHIKDMKQGSVDVYTYGDSSLRVAVEYCSPTSKSGGKASDVYFCFNNPKLNMITGGVWEINMYPHCPCKYAPKDVMFTFFLEFDGELLQAEIVLKENKNFLFFHRKTTPIKNPDSDIIVSSEYNPQSNYVMCLTRQNTKFEQKIMSMFKTNKVFYQDNEVGEIVRNYIIWSDKQSIKN